MICRVFFWDQKWPAASGCLVISKPSTVWKAIPKEIWLVVWLPFFIFPYIGLLIIPIDFHIFQRGGPTTNQERSPSFYVSLPNETLIDRWFSSIFCSPQASFSKGLEIVSTTARKLSTLDSDDLGLTRSNDLAVQLVKGLLKGLHTY